MAPRPRVQHHQPEPPAGTVIRVYRHTPADHFTIVPNAIARGRLPVPLRSLARCLLIHLLSLPPGWEITRAEINRAFVEGREAVSVGIRQLREAGYLRQERGHDETTGRFVWRWEITDDPAAFAQVDPSDGFSVDGEQQTDPEPETRRSTPVTGFPSMVEPSMVNPSTVTTTLEELTPHLPPPPNPDLPQPVVDPVVEEARAVLDRVNAAAPRGRMGHHQLAALTPAVAAVLHAGVWTSSALGEHLAANLDGIKSAYSVTRYRLDDLPEVLPKPAARPARPMWCGTCDEPTRMRETPEGAPYRCPVCHPLKPLTGVQQHQEVTTICRA
jgi:hypothetical protein